ncbi:hypothetical protein D3C81_1705350 [compost metagenome]
MLRPTVKAPVATVQTGCAIGCPHRGFNQQRTGTTHRIEQRRTRLPARTHHDSRSQRLFDRRLTGTIAIAALMQTITAKIEGNAGGIFVQPDVNTQIRGFAIHIRTGHIFTGKGIDNRVLYF